MAPATYLELVYDFMPSRHAMIASFGSLKKSLNEAYGGGRKEMSFLSFHELEKSDRTKTLTELSKIQAERLVHVAPYSCRGPEQCDFQLPEAFAKAWSRIDHPIATGRVYLLRRAFR